MLAQEYVERMNPEELQRYKEGSKGIAEMQEYERTAKFKPIISFGELIRYTALTNLASGNNNCYEALNTVLNIQ